jgi:N-methylhydantoinase A
VNATQEFRVGVDIGGTFTDLVAVDGSGRVARAKSPTTHDDYTRGIRAGLEALSDRAGTSLAELMASTQVFINGTTIVTNSIAELRGRRVGVLVTEGFGDTLRIARGARTNERDLHTQGSPPEIVRREDVVEITERIDRNGDTVVALDEDSVRRAIATLVDEQGCEALAVCLLWSFVNPAHEERIKAIANELHPDLFVSISSEVRPVAREYERLVTTAFNSYTSRGVAEYVGALERHLEELGCSAKPSLMQAVGGLLSPDEARDMPIQLINSGPVGGVIGAREMARRLGLSHVITADMGGTSLDTALIEELEVAEAHRAQIGRFPTGLSMVDISAIGAGGGSIFWIDNRGAPQVGPQSAGSMPGPACYGNGGTEPTVTDVAVAMGLMDPDYFLGGEITLDAGAAAAAITTKLAEPLGWDLDRTLTGMHRIIVDTMANAVRAISIQRGHDPRRFTMVAYGGASGLFLPLIGQSLGIRETVVPASASVFSAYGLLSADGRRSFVQTVNWPVLTGALDGVNASIADLAGKARVALERRGFDDADITLTFEGDFMFAGQMFEVTVPLDSGTLGEADRELLVDRFTATYERLYGPGTAWNGFPVMLHNIRVNAIGRIDRPVIQREPAASNGAAAAEIQPHHHRSVLLPEDGTRREIPAYRGTDMHHGASIPGPAVIDDIDTTIYVPSGGECRVDEFRNYRLTV